MSNPAANMSMCYDRLVLSGVAYAVVPEAVFLRVCERAAVDASAGGAARPADSLAEAADDSGLAARLTQRRRAAGLTQTELARRAGVRVETLNRIERGHTTPDFATIRKLVTAIQAVELSGSAS